MRACLLTFTPVSQAASTMCVYLATLDCTESGSLLPNCAQSLSGVSAPCFLVGDPAYPLRPWLMKPFINTGCLTPQQQCFNNRLSKSRVVVQHAFGRLKGRWRCLRNKLSVCIDDVPEVIGACCILHNLCQTHGEVFEDTWLENETEPYDPRASGTGNSTLTRVLVGRMCAEHWQNTSTTVTSVVTNHSLLAVVYSAIVHVHLHACTYCISQIYMSL